MFVVQVLEQRGGGSKKPWIIAGVMVASAVAAALILWPKPKSTGSIIIDVPAN